jgi:hypothetical protein
MANRTQRSFGILMALCLVGALAAWGCEQAGGTVGTPAGPSSATAAAKSGESTPAATPTPPSAPAPEASSKIPPADDALVTMLTLAIQDEYHAYWTYNGVLEDLGKVKPFTSIENAEDQHVGAVSKLFTKRGLAVPASTWSLENVPRFNALVDACEAGVDAEVENYTMYDGFLGGDLPSDVEKVFTNLRDASKLNHLPAFENCAGK